MTETESKPMDEGGQRDGIPKAQRWGGPLSEEEEELQGEQELAEGTFLRVQGWEDGEYSGLWGWMKGMV